MRPRHILLALLVAALWGFNFVPIKTGLEHFPPLLFASLRFVAAALPAVFFVRRPPVAVRWLFLVGVPLGVGQFGLLFIAMRLGMPAGLSSVVLQTAALFTALFATVMLRERLTGPQIAGMGVAFVGVAMMGVAQSGGQGSPVLAFLLCLASAFMWGLGNIGMRRMNQSTTEKVDPLAFMVWMSLVPPIPLFALSMIFEGPGAVPWAIEHFSWAGVGSLAYIAYVSTLVGFGVWGWLMGRYPAGTVAMYALLVPPFGLLSAVLVLGEHVDAFRLLAAALIVSGVAIGNLRGRRVPVPEPEPLPALTR